MSKMKLYRKENANLTHRAKRTGKPVDPKDRSNRYTHSSEVKNMSWLLVGLFIRAGLMQRP